MNSRSSLCRSDSKVRNPINRVNAARSSLQNENLGIKRQRSSSLDFRARGSGSTPKPRSSSDERKSGLFPGRNSNRKSSINLDGGKTFKEFRPLTDKAYQKKKLMELIEFLTEFGYPHLLNLSKLMQPSKKDFENIFQHLVRFFEPNFEVKKLEDDGPKMLKSLCYPFIPNKSAFMYVARTNWPPLLGVLLYLMDLSKFAVNIDENSFFHNAEFERPEEHAILLEYIFTSFFQEDENSYNEEEEKEIFTKIIKSRSPYDIEELKAKRKILNQELESFQIEVDSINALKEQSRKLDTELKQFDTFFVEMKEHKKKKEDTCQKYAEEVAQRESELQGLQEILTKKQDLYDAQGYDGKKQLSYFENQKKELMEKLEVKKSVYRELQNDCGEAEILHREAIDKGAATCETFNDLYSSISDSASNILAPLQNLNDPQVKNLCSNFKLEFPDCSMQPNQKCVVQWSNARKTSLEEVKERIDSANLIFKGLVATQNQKIHGLLMKKSELAVNLNMASSEEVQKERDLTSKEKQALEDMKSVESECNDMIKQLEALQAERLKLEEENTANQEELCKLEKIKKEKQKMLDDYLVDQRNLFAKWAKDIVNIKQLCQDSGEEIVEAIEKAVKRTF